MAPRRPSPLFALLLIGALLCAGLSRGALSQPPAVDTDHPFDTAAATERLARILGDERPHPVGTEAADGVVERLVAEMRAAGLEPEIVEDFHCRAGWHVVCARIRNVKGWIGEPGADAVLLASHHDSVPTGPGAADDGMGVTASLEIARRLQLRAAREGGLPRPVLVLVTDAEEIGLVGAHHFVTRDPDAARVSAVVSLEARGNRGTATMFETSAPNGRDIAALGGLASGERTRLPLTNSMAVDIYRRMPNGTDVTEYLKLGPDALNFSMIGRYTDYHTRDDTVANLDPRSLFHNGASAMAAVDRLLDAGGPDASAPEGEWIYGDLLGRMVLKLPAHVALPVLALTVLLAVAAAVRSGARHAWRAAALPPLALVLGIALAVLASLGIAALRPESAFGTAHPWAMRGLQHGAGLLGAALATAWLYRPGAPRRFVWAAVAWVFALGALGSLALPGLAYLFVFPALVLTAAAGVELLGRTRISAGLIALASLLYAALALPASDVAESALFVESAAPFILPVLVLFILWRPLLAHRMRIGRGALAAAAAATLGFGLAAALVPAYSEAQTLGRNLFHVDGDALETPEFRMSARDPLPDGWERFGFAREGGRFRADAPPLDFDPPRTLVTGDRVDGASRVITLAIAAPGTDRLVVRTTGEARPRVSRVSVNGAVVEDHDHEHFTLRVHGRAAQDVTLEFAVPATHTGDIPLSVTDVRYGLTGEGLALDRARPAWTGPQHDGDQRYHGAQVSVPALQP